MDDVDKLCVSRIDADKFGHVLEEWLGWIQSGDASKLANASVLQSFSSVSGNVSSKRVSNDVEAINRRSKV